MCESFKHESHNMVKQTQIIRQLTVKTNCLSMFDHVVGLALKCFKASSDVPVYTSWVTHEMLLSTCSS